MERRRLAQDVKEARAESKKAREDLKRHAQTVNDAANWTAKVLEGESSRFASSTDETAAKLAQATYGLKSYSEFKGTRERLEQEEAAAAAEATNQNNAHLTRVR